LRPGLRPARYAPVEVDDRAGRVVEREAGYPAAMLLWVGYSRGGPRSRLVSSVRWEATATRGGRWAHRLDVMSLRIANFNCENLLSRPNILSLDCSDDARTGYGHRTRRRAERKAR
jgi:hypothetical protein